MQKLPSTQGELTPKAPGPTSPGPAQTESTGLSVLGSAEVEVKTETQALTTQEPPAAAPAKPGGVLAFINPGAVPWVIVGLVAAFVAVRLSTRALQRVSERFVQHRLALKQLTTFLAFAVYGVTLVLAITSLFDFSSETLFALSGGAAVTVGFALKDFAASFFASVTVLITKPFQVGDRVAFDGFYGEITEIGLRSVRMVTLDDNLVTIPSNKFLTEAVASANAGALDCMVVIPFFLSAQTDHRAAKQIVRDAILSSRYLYLGKPFTVLTSCEIAEHGGAYLKMIAKAYVYDARHEKAFASDVTEQVLDEFTIANIDIAGHGDSKAAA